MKLKGKGFNIPVEILGITDSDCIRIHIKDMAEQFKDCSKITQVLSYDEGKTWLLLAEDWHGLRYVCPVSFENSGRKCYPADLWSYLALQQSDKIRTDFRL